MCADICLKIWRLCRGGRYLIAFIFRQVSTNFNGRPAYISPFSLCLDTLVNKGSELRLRKRADFSRSNFTAFKNH